MPDNMLKIEFDGSDAPKDVAVELEQHVRKATEPLRVHATFRAKSRFGLTEGRCVLSMPAVLRSSKKSERRPQLSSLNGAFFGDLDTSQIDGPTEKSATSQR